MNKLNWMTKACGVFLLWVTAAVALPAQTFTTLLNFDGTNGQFPDSALVQATNGYFYGTTYSGGVGSNDGTVFRITPGGTLTTLFSFDDTDGAIPQGALVQGTDGNVYGTTAFGGGLGSAFKITPGGILTTLYNFCQFINCTDGSYPDAGLVEGTDGNFYGTTTSGGPDDDGTIFKLTTSGVLTTLHRFQGTDGAIPAAALIRGADGNFYGTTTFYGANGEGGTVFKITPGGALTTIYNFCSLPGCIDGEIPNGLVQASNGVLYGTAGGGANGYGEVFKLTSSGALTTIYSFCPLSNCTDGSYPSGLIQGTDGNFYGTADEGGTTGGNCGTFGCGTVFKITQSGTLTTLHSFDYTDGYGPAAAPVQGTDGTFYGSAEFGGANSTCIPGCGTIFSLSVGLKPFVETNPTYGAAGTVVKILGTNLTGSTSVTFNGTAAAFTVVSGSLITTTVPTGATTGTVQVGTPGRTLTSNTRFTVN